MVLQPRHCPKTTTVWANPRSLATTGGIIIYFLFLWVLRCFSSPRMPTAILQCAEPSTRRVVPFGNLRVTGHLHLTAAYRSLSRPSSLVRAKASTVRPYILSIACVMMSTTSQRNEYTFGCTFHNVSFSTLTCFYSMSKITRRTILPTQWRITDSNR